MMAMIASNEMKARENCCFCFMTVCMLTQKRKTLVLLRMLRPVLHVLTIVAMFWCMAILRQYTDLIPFVQLKIPAIDLGETLLFAGLSACVFL